MSLAMQVYDSRVGTLCCYVQASEQLLEQQQDATAKEADMSHVVGQLREQLLSAQAEAEQTHAAAKLKQIEYESQAQALSEVR